jgi:flagellar hook protein FlgE
MSIASLYTAVSALRSHQEFLSVVANNLANVNTTGYKASRVLFADAISQTLSVPTDAGATSAGTNGVQIGLGTRLGSITPLFTQGSLQSTGVKTDIAIQGDGFFVVQNPVNGENFYTRAGAFNLQRSADPLVLGRLVTPTGESVQGALIDFAAGDTSAPPLAALGAIDIPTEDPLGAIDAAGNIIAVRDFNIDTTGRVTLILEDGSTSPFAQISLQKFSNPEALLKNGNNLYSATLASGKIFTDGAVPPLDVFQVPGTNGLGEMSTGFLELSNVDLGQEFSDMIRAQRGLQASARVITTSDEILQELIGLKR